MTVRTSDDRSGTFRTMPLRQPHPMATPRTRDLPEYLPLSEVARSFPGIDVGAVRARILTDPASRLRGGVGSGETTYDLPSIIRAVQKESV